MEDYDITALREWAPLTEVLEKIPSRVQKNLFSSDLNITCVDVITEFIALGTDAGIVFWYNRLNGDIQKLRAEISSPLTCIKVVSSVEYMVAAGSRNGQVSVFQIQKDIPEDLNLVVSLMKSKPIERYTIRDLHKSAVTCCEWSKNGMRLFSGDKQGVVVQTEFDYQAHLSKSIEILNEAYGIVQLNVHQSYLLVSTVYRSIICKREQQNINPTVHATGNGGGSKWKISQIGKKDRKILYEFGAAFRDRDTLNSNMKSSQIICSRPGYRLWLADITGNVEQTLIFKDTMTSKPHWDIPLLNPSKTPKTKISNFGKILMLSRNHVITYDDSVLLIINIDNLRLEAIAKGFRKILDVTICGKEIFVLEGSRSLIRISTCPEPPSKTAKIIFNPMLPPPVPGLSLSIFESPIEFEPEDDVIINAEECFELPPIQEIDLDIPIQTNIDSPTTQKNKLIMEQSRRIEIFDKINEMEFDDSILYRSGIGKKHRKDSFGGGAGSKKNSKNNGIVEIGQSAKEFPEVSTVSSISTKSTSETPKTGKSEKEILQADEENKKIELTTRPHLMEASFCSDTLPLPDLRSPDTLKRVLEPKEKALAEELDLEPVKLCEISEEELKKATEQTERNNSKLPLLQYPINYPLTTKTVDDAEVQTTPRKKIHFINEYDDDNLDEMDGRYCNVFGNALNTADTTNLCDQFKKNVMIQSDCTNNSSSIDAYDDGNNFLNSNNKMVKSLQFVKCNLVNDEDNDNGISPSVPDVKPFPEFMKIPSLWNDKIEKIDIKASTETRSASATTTKTTVGTDEQEQSDSQTSGDWEFVD